MLLFITMKNENNRFYLCKAMRPFHGRFYETTEAGHHYLLLLAEDIKIFQTDIVTAVGISATKNDSKRMLLLRNEPIFKDSKDEYSHRPKKIYCEPFEINEIEASKFIGICDEMFDIQNEKIAKALQDKMLPENEMTTIWQYVNQKSREKSTIVSEKYGYLKSFKRNGATKKTAANLMGKLPIFGHILADSKIDLITGYATNRLGTKTCVAFPNEVMAQFRPDIAEKNSSGSGYYNTQLYIVDGCVFHASTKHSHSIKFTSKNNQGIRIDKDENNQWHIYKNGNYFSRITSKHYPLLSQYLNKIVAEGYKPELMEKKYLPDIKILYSIDKTPAMEKRVVMLEQYKARMIGKIGSSNIYNLFHHQGYCRIKQATSFIEICKALKECHQKISAINTLLKENPHDFSTTKGAHLLVKYNKLFKKTSNKLETIRFNLKQIGKNLTTTNSNDLLKCYQHLSKAERLYSDYLEEIVLKVEPTNKPLDTSDENNFSMRRV